MKIEVKDRIMSHEKPIIAVLYNTVYNQVGSIFNAVSAIPTSPWKLFVNSFHNFMTGNVF